MPDDAAPSDNAPQVHFLIAGDATDLPLIHQLLCRLPVDAYGQVFIEVAARFQVIDLPAPPRLAVSWLVDDTSPLSLTPGTRAANAVLAWVSEWMPDEPAAHNAPYVIWIGCSATSVMDRLSDSLGDRLGRLHLHRPGE